MQACQKIGTSISCSSAGRAFIAPLALIILLSSAPQAQEAALNGSRLTSGSDVRAAFTDVIAPARKSVVRVLCDGKPAALGTIIDADGSILTKGSDLNGQIVCRLLDGRELPATYVAYHPDTDLALLDIEATELTPIDWSADADPLVGQWLATPGHESAPVGVGIVSVPRRAIESERISGVLGVRLEDFEGAAKIAEIIEDSAAAAAQLLPGDLIKRVDDNEINGREALVRLIREHQPGATVNITVLRGDEELVVPATLTHPFGQFLSRIAAQNHMGGELSLRRTGFSAVLQHDTVLRPQDCGGPLVNLDGQAIGVNIARAGRTESYAIPAGVIVPLLAEMREGRYPPPAGADSAAPPAPSVQASAAEEAP
jgi:serine protease Do